jgi:hypothetical protein
LVLLNSVLFNPRNREESSGQFSAVREWEAWRGIESELDIVVTSALSAALVSTALTNHCTVHYTLS